MAFSRDEKSANVSGGEHDESTMSSPSPRLTFNQLQQWDHKQLSSSPPTASSSPPLQSTQQQQQQQPMYSMSSGLLPSQQIVAMMDDMNRSESSTASSFNLSTDAEDSEYETMKRTSSGIMYYPPGHLNMTGLSALDTSAIDTVTSITSYTTDEDRKIFPNLPTDDEMTLGTEASSKRGEPQPPSLLLPLSLPNSLQGSQVTVQIPVPDHINGETTSIGIRNNNNNNNNLDPSWTDFHANIITHR